MPYGEPKRGVPRASVVARSPAGEETRGRTTSSSRVKSERLRDCALCPRTAIGVHTKVRRRAAYSFTAARGCQRKSACSRELSNSIRARGRWRSNPRARGGVRAGSRCAGLRPALSRVTPTRAGPARERDLACWPSRRPRADEGRRYARMASMRLPCRWPIRLHSPFAPGPAGVPQRHPRHHSSRARAADRRKDGSTSSAPAAARVRMPEGAARRKETDLLLDLLARCHSNSARRSGSRIEQVPRRGIRARSPR